jgi:hypothetical protein
MKKRETKKLTPERLQQFGFAYAPPLIISAAVNNKVFDKLQDGPKTVEQLKKETGASARGLRAIMDALVGLELLKKDRQSRYSLTPESRVSSAKTLTLAGFSDPVFRVGFGDRRRARAGDAVAGQRARAGWNVVP